VKLTKEERKEYTHLVCLEELDWISTKQLKRLRELREKAEIIEFSPDYAFGGRCWEK
jgi:hypothetical protein